MLLRHTYMSPEDEGEESGGGGNSSTFNREELAEFIKSQVKEGVSSTLQEAANFRAEQPSPGTPEVEDPWDALISPRVKPGLAQAQLMAQAADDKVDFYSSPEWEQVDDWLVEEDPEKRRAEKAEMRKKVESAFSNLLKQGKGLHRADIFNSVLGEKIRKDKEKFVESIGKRKAKQESDALDKARRAVEPTPGSISSFTRDDVLTMDEESFTKKLGALTF